MNRSMTFAVAVLLAALPAQAQEWAKARLKDSPRHREEVKVKHGSRTVECFLVYPEVKHKATAVVVIHEIFGLTDWAREMTDELAGAGYIAVAPDLLSGIGPGAGGTEALGDQRQIGKAIRDLPPRQITADLNAVVDYVSKLPSCNGKVVVAGFCWGGGQSFRFSTNNKKIKAAFVFYGPAPRDAAAIARIQCPVYGFYAGNDARIGATVPGTIDAMKAAEKTYKPATYEGAGHGFMRAGEAPDASPGNKKARNEAWKRLLKLLKTV
jgi:carboxymethylenebutenolidase